MSGAGAGSIIQGAGVHMENVGTYMQGLSAEEAAKFEARQLRRNALAVEAQGQRQAKEIRWQGDMLKSGDIARQAAGGGGIDTQSLAKISNMTDYNALAALYQSGTEADYLRDAAKIREWEGKIAKREAIRGTVTNFMSYAGGAMGGMGGKGGGYKPASGTIGSDGLSSSSYYGPYGGDYSGAYGRERE